MLLDVVDKRARDWLPRRAAHLSSHVPLAEAEEGQAEHTHSHSGAGWRFSAVWEPWRAAYVGRREELSSSIA